jgi:[ribosomal protein S5]-alanine N-acetyltransferase
LSAVELVSDRLILRSISEADAELYYELFCDPETMRFIGAPWTRAEAAHAFREVLAANRCTPPRAVFLTINPREAQQPTGLCTLQNFDPVRRQAEMGVMIASSARAQGYATEALIALIAHAFATLPCDEVWVRIAVGHGACERTAVNIGLVRHAEMSPEDRAANVWRWSAYRDSWRPAAVSVRCCAAHG